MTDLPARAEAFARAVHHGQRRKGAAAEPYVTHLEEVAAFTARHGGDAAALAAAWLHDTVEDCPGVTPATILTLFGPEVAGLVAELTDDKSLPKAERKRLQEANAPKKSPRAALVKLGDKTSNVAALAASPPATWSEERKAEYIAWALRVTGRLPAPPAAALAEFRAAAATAAARLSTGDKPAS